MQIIKTVKYYRNGISDEILQKDFTLKEKTTGTSKRILDYLIQNENLSNIVDIRNKKRIKVVYYTTSLDPNQETTKTFLFSEYPNNKLIFDYLDQNENLDFINRIEDSFLIEEINYTIETKEGSI